jgi:predicted dehydrogenase
MPTASGVTRVAIVGTGMVAHWHVRGWRDAGASVVAVADVDRRAMDAFADAYGVDARFSSIDALLADGIAGATVVSICTPPALHHDMVLSALDAGRHVLVEKPFAVHAADAATMAERAVATGRVLGCRQASAHLHTDARRLRRIVRSGVLGELSFLRLVGRTAYRPGIEYHPDAAWFLDKRVAGGGALFDWGVYDLDLLFSLIGDVGVVEVDTLAMTPVVDADGRARDVEAHAVVVLRLASGCTVVWERGWVTHLPKYTRWELYGRDAGLAFTPHTDVLRRAPEIELSRFDGGRITDVPLPGDDDGTEDDAGPTVYEDFLQAVADGRPAASPPAQNVRIVSIVQAAYESAALGRPVQFDPAV